MSGLKFLPTCPISRLKPFDRNPRKNDKAVEAVARSIKEFGFNQPIVVSAKMEVCAGHTRLKAAQVLGLSTVPVIVAPGLTGNKFTGYNIADNQTATLADWNIPDLTELLKELQAEEFDLGPLGFSDKELSDLLGDAANPGNDPDHIPDLPKKPISKPGDLWILGGHRLLCGDSTKAEDVKRLMGKDRAILMNTDPPYGVALSSTKDGIPRPGFKNHKEQWGDLKNDTLEGKAIQPFLESAFRAAQTNALDENAAWYLWHAHLTGAFFAAAAAADIILHRQIIWRKPGFVLTRSGMYHWSHEPCFYGWKRGHRPPWHGDKSQRSVWEVGRDSDHGQHPTQKPVELFAIPMRNHTRSGEIVYEPFSGSGSQIIAAESLGRRCYAIEIEPRYVDVAVERWQQFTGKKAKRAA